MFEKRPIWGIIFGLNVCVLIWLISVQEPVMYDATTSAISSGINNNGGGVGKVASAETQKAVNGAVGGRDLLSKHYDEQQQAIASTLTTLTYNNNNNSYFNNITNLIQNSSLQNIKPEKNVVAAAKTITTPTKTLDLSLDISLTSSLGTGVLDIQSKPTPSWKKLTAVSSALPAEDFNQLIDLHNFKYLMPQPVCNNHIEALILIHSAPKNHEKRQIIRETWGSIGHHITDAPLRVIFLLGAVESEQQQMELKMENDLNADIIQGSFMDDYRNMTYKHIMAFKWFLYNCPQAQILIKVDDDVYVNTPRLIKYLKLQQEQEEEQELEKVRKKEKQQKQQQQQYQNNFTNNNKNPTITTTTTTAIPKTTKYSIFDSLNIFAKLSSSSSSSSSSKSSKFNASQQLFHHPQNLLFCQKIIGSLVKRSYRSKWRVSFKEYSERYYPPYCPGYAIIYSPDVIFRLYTAAQSSKYFWIDDVHITGVLAHQTNTTITTSTHYVLYSDECDDLLSGKTDLNDMEFLFAWHSITAQKIRLLWHLQMMSLKTLDELQYKRNDASGNERLAYDIFSSASSSLTNSYTSSDGLR